MAYFSSSAAFCWASRSFFCSILASFSILVYLICVMYLLEIMKMSTFYCRLLLSRIWYICHPQLLCPYTISLNQRHLHARNAQMQITRVDYYFSHQEGDQLIKSYRKWWKSPKHCLRSHYEIDFESGAWTSLYVSSSLFDHAVPRLLFLLIFPWFSSLLITFGLLPS